MASTSRRPPSLVTLQRKVLSILLILTQIPVEIVESHLPRHHDFRGEKLLAENVDDAVDDGSTFGQSDSRSDADRRQGKAGKHSLLRSQRRFALLSGTQAIEWGKRV